MPHRLRALVAARANYRCEYCQAPEAIFNSPFDVEHIVPSARDGADEDWNLALACRACNGSKHVATSAIDPVEVRSVRLFNPRIDAWSEHFTLDTSSAEMAGQTDIGRATVIRLQMNGPRQLAARRFWIQLFDFPLDLPESS